MHTQPSAGTEARPLVAVLMPVFNAAVFLPAAIESVLGQSYDELELVAVDDGSTDRSWTILEGYAARDSRLRIFRSLQNSGVARTRNRALGHASPEARYVAVADADDICLPHRLERQVAFLEKHPDHGLVGGHNIVIDALGREIGCRKYPCSDQEIRDVITRFCPFSQPSVLLRRSALEASGGYDLRYEQGEDYDLWFRITEHHKVANLDDYVLKYRLSSTQLKQRQLRKALKNTLHIQRQWLFDPRFFRPENVGLWLARHLLLPLPDAVILQTFKWVTYRKVRHVAA